MSEHTLDFPSTTLSERNDRVCSSFVNTSYTPKLASKLRSGVRVDRKRSMRGSIWCWRTPTVREMLT